MGFIWYLYHIVPGLKTHNAVYVTHYTGFKTHKHAGHMIHNTSGQVTQCKSSSV